MRLGGFDKNSKQQIGQQNKCPNLPYLIDEDVGRGGMEWCNQCHLGACG